MSNIYSSIKAARSVFILLTKDVATGEKVASIRALFAIGREVQITYLQRNHQSGIVNDFYLHFKENEFLMNFFCYAKET
jgi:hypothetical protein